MRLPKVKLSFQTGSYGELRSIGKRNRSDSPRPFELDHYETLELLHSQSVLQDSLKELRSYIESRADDSQDSPATLAAKTALHNAQTSNAHIGEFLDQVADLTPPHQRPPTAQSTTKANQVFATPGLMEEILGYLSIGDKLDAMRVQRTWCNTVNDSIKLKRSLGLAAHQDLFYSSPFSTLSNTKPVRYHFECGDARDRRMPGAYYRDQPSLPDGYFSDSDSDSEERSNSDSVDDGVIFRCININIEVNSIRKGIRLGSRVRSMAICNPPLKSLLVLEVCQ